MNIAEKIQEILDKKGISSYKMCKDIGMPQATFTKWKNENKNPSIDRIILIAQYLDISIDELTGIKKTEKFISSEEIKTIEAYREAPNNIKNIVDTALEQYKKKENKGKLSS